MTESAAQQPGREPCIEPAFRSQFDRLLEDLAVAVSSVYGARLVSLLVFGSVGRGKPRPDSDVDLLLVADPLPDGRISRMREFEQVETLLESRLRSLSQSGVTTSLSPVFKTPDEVLIGSLIFLDMVDHAIVLFDRGGFAETFLKNLSTRLDRLGAQKITRRGSWHWVLKPDYRQGEVFDI